MGINPKQILIATGSFKDVFSPSEACKELKLAIQESFPMAKINVIPIVDGGEYSLGTIVDYLKLKKVAVEKTLGPDLSLRTKYYANLGIDKYYISSSSVMKLDVKNIDQGNPLELTSFGLGQLINDAIDKGAKDIFIGLGGTSTVDAGLGMLQALGALFFDEEYNLINGDGIIMSGCDMQRVKYMDLSIPVEKCSKIKFHALCDGSPSINQMDIPIRQKIGKKLEDKDQIFEALWQGIQEMCNVFKEPIRNMSSHNFKEKLSDAPYYGAAGGTLFSILAITPAKVSLGFDYFSEWFKLHSKIKQADLIVTGEGKFDNSLFGKTPIGIAKVALSYNKKLVYIAGTVESVKQINEYLVSPVPQELKEVGVSYFLVCNNHYRNKELPSLYGPLVNYLKRESKVAFRNAFKEFSETIY